jgi:GNAT superfamily N-acetyltransferase
MLDKSIPYYNIIMKYSWGTSVPEPKLPSGYVLRHYQPGDEFGWAEIEAAVGEFESARDALLCFTDHYLPYPERLGERCLFACDGGGRPVATCTAWWDTRNGAQVPSLHWVGVHPEHQNKGLGKAVVFQCMRDLAALEPGWDVWLHTQSWSYKAIGIYLAAGFELQKSETINSHRNDYALALPLLAEKMKPGLLPKADAPA